MTQSIEEQLAQARLVGIDPTSQLIILQCADESPAWDQRLRLIEMTHEDDDYWYGYHAGRPRQGDPSQFPRFAWKRAVLPQLQPVGPKGPF